MASLSVNKGLKYILPISFTSTENSANSPAKKTEVTRLLRKPRSYGTPRNKDVSNAISVNVKRMYIDCTHTHTHTHTQRNSHIHTLTYLNAHLNTHNYTETQVNTKIHKYTNIDKALCKYTHGNKCTYILTHTNTYWKKTEL